MPEDAGRTPPVRPHRDRRAEPPHARRRPFLTPPRRSLGLVVLLLPLVVPAAAGAQTPPADADCLACHEDPELARADGRPLARDLGRLAASVHGQAGLACVDCHDALAAAAEFPHPEDLPPPQCATCHDQPVEEHRRGVHHAAAGRAGGRGAGCADCHGAHDIKPSADPASATYHLNLSATCGQCHADTAKMGDKAVAGLFADSIHGQALSRRGLVVAPNCATCHGSHAILPPDDAESRVHRTRVAATCGKCHEGIANEYATSIHAAAVAAGNLAGAVCSDCHTAHEIAATVPGWRLEVVQECGACHEESVRTYRDGFHGQASALGYTRVATCADCHGAHGILAAADPRSRVAEGNRVQTCSRCHPGATASFVQFDPHADAGDPKRSRPVYFTALAMKALLASVFAFFGIHTALWFPRSWQARRAARDEHAKRKESSRGEDDPSVHQ